MAEKKYYWLKLKEGFFDQKIIKKLRKIAGGDTYVIIYLKMQLLGLRSEGKFVYEGIGDDFIEELAMELEEDEENVRVTLMYLEKAGIIEILSDNQYFMPSVIEATGSESSVTERVRKCRERKKEDTHLLECSEKKEETNCNGGETACNNGLSECNSNGTDCNNSLLQYNSSETSCNGNETECNNELLQCNTEIRDKRKEKDICPSGEGRADKKALQKLYFERFWQAYPRKTAKKEAEKAWKKLTVDESFYQQLCHILEKHKQQEEWKKEKGQYIPYPASWLNGERWLDSLAAERENPLPKREQSSGKLEELRKMVGIQS